MLLMEFDSPLALIQPFSRRETHLVLLVGQNTKTKRYEIEECFKADQLLVQCR